MSLIKLHHSLDNLIKEAIDNEVFTCAEILCARHSQIFLNKVYGKISIEKKSPLLKPNAIFDIASLTKILTVSLAFAKLLEQEKELLILPIKKIFPSSKHYNDITIKHLLTHTSGLPDWADLFSPYWNKKEGWEKLLSIKPLYKPETKMIYSCLGFILLTDIFQKIAHIPLTQFCNEQFYKPLNLEKTSFSSPKNIKDVIPTTDRITGKYLCGIVHDENARLFQGESGNAGLFSSANDIHRIVTMLLQEGIYERKSYLQPQIIEKMWTNHNPHSLPARGLGWDYNKKNQGYMSCGKNMPEGAIGHVGYTGCSLWIEPYRKTIYIILTNRAHMTNKRSTQLIKTFRTKCHDICLLLSKNKLVQNN